MVLYDSHSQLIIHAMQLGVSSITQFWLGCSIQSLKSYNQLLCISRQLGKFGLTCSIGILKVMVLGFFI